MFLGAHVSIAGGFDKSLDRGAELGANVIMTFASSPRSLSHAAVPSEIIAKYLRNKKTSPISLHFFHGVYLVNLASGSRDYLQASINSLISYQQLAASIEGVGTIFHVGTCKGLKSADTISQIVEAVNYVTDSSPKGLRLILENSAGQAGSVGSDLAELGQIISRVGDKSKIGACLDTQHLFAAGYDLKTALDKFDRAVGLKNLSVIHLNDSKTEFSSHVDRHANLGEGYIGIDNLRTFVQDPRLKKIPIILEVPGDAQSGPRKRDVDSLRSLVDN